MTTPSILIVSGPPCTGKTALAKRLAHDLSLPYIGKDRIKETLFDALGWADREWSKKLGVAAWELLYVMVETELEAGRSFVVEGNFDPDAATTRFLQLHDKYPFEACQVLCYTDGDVLLARFKRRAQSEERHPGHVDHLNYEEMTPVLLRGRCEPLQIGGTILQIDTSNFAQVEYNKVLEGVRAAFRL